MILSVFKVFYVKVMQMQLLVDDRSDSTKMHRATIRFKPDHLPRKVKRAKF